jgi:hypothetical protein
MTQLNTPYPATAYLTGFLKLHGYAVAQHDLAMDLMLNILSRLGLESLFAEDYNEGFCIDLLESSN